MIMIEIFFKLKSKHNLYFIYDISNQSVYMSFVVFIKINLYYLFAIFDCGCNKSQLTQR